MEDMFEVPEEMPATSFEQEETFGIIHKIFFTKENKSYVVNVQFATEGKDAPHLRIVQYKKIFTDGRFFFQKFCKDFGAVVNEDSVDLSKALGKLCKTEYNPEFQNFQLRYVPDSKAPELRKYFGKMIIPEPEPVPPIIADYWYMPYYRGKSLFQAELLGFIYSHKTSPDLWNPDDETICFNVAVFNGGHTMKTQYYLNRIYGDGYNDYQYFGTSFDILDENDNIYPDDILFIPCIVKLKTAKDNLYARELVPAEFANEYHEKQAKLLINWYRKEMQKSDNKPKFKTVLRCIKHD